MWWGQGAPWRYVMTNNGFPLDLIKLSNPEPTFAALDLSGFGPFKLCFLCLTISGLH